VGGEVCLPGGDEVGGLGGDHGAVGVGDQAGESSVHRDHAVVVGVGVSRGVSVGVGGDLRRVHGTTSGGVGNLGGVHLRGVDGHHGTVGVSDQASEVGVASSVSVGVDRVHGTAGGKVGQLGGVHLRGVHGHHGAVGVGHQLGGGEGHAGRENLVRAVSEEVNHL